MMKRVSLQQLWVTRLWHNVITALCMILALTVGMLVSPSSLGVSLAAADTPDNKPLTDYLLPESKEVPKPVRTEQKPRIPNLPSGVFVDHVDWLNDHRIALFIHSAAMPEQLIQVQVLLARDWYRTPEATFPELWALDGMGASEVANGWTLSTNIEDFFSDKNINVILPVGGKGSFYTDWDGPANGQTYKWETFLVSELLPILKNGYRGNGLRAIVGPSMGGTAAVTLAEHHSDMFEFVGSFSGYLDTTTEGMPRAIGVAQREFGNFDPKNMWGDVESSRWKENDPKLGVESLKEKTVYVSAGNGKSDFGQADAIATAPGNLAGEGLEIVSRMTTQTFIDRAKKADVEVIAKLRDAGVHSWDFWQFELTQSWGMMADALKIDKAGRGTNCTPQGAIAQATSKGQIGECINDEYDVKGGRAEDFTNGTAYWSPKTGAHLLIGDIRETYVDMGATESWLGFPKTSELAAGKEARRVHFEHGSLYWSPKTGTHAIPKTIFDAWGSQSWENGVLGLPVEEAVDGEKAKAQKFEGGWIIQEDDQTTTLTGYTGLLWGRLGGLESKLGVPVEKTRPVNGGYITKFANGMIYSYPGHGAQYVPFGDIFDYWGQNGYEGGKYGWPVSGLQKIPAGGNFITFQGGTIEQINGIVSGKPLAEAQPAPGAESAPKP